MTTITNSDTFQSREAQIITTSDNDLNWCIAVWAAPDKGYSEVDGNGHGWQVVRLQNDGSYTYNNTMMGGYRDSLEDVRSRAIASGYSLI
ncbi:hypothetical protein ASD64_08850 [Mesorhizobium sp. Root157]|uniref:hypothetical protein n=1 Tax=Mesorhizobium sp. Root157 TaxID=1736477 RepID=UPI0006F2AAF1|nr:hypothetical protein [Mesorhizobium sp. Root157]KQZ81858.1 hypothetical protein ASD64_08850 [Mesorhizobium sp. Root157]